MVSDSPRGKDENEMPTLLERMTEMMTETEKATFSFEQDARATAITIAARVLRSGGPVTIKAPPVDDIIELAVFILDGGDIKPILNEIVHETVVNGGVRCGAR